MTNYESPVMIRTEELAEGFILRAEASSVTVST